MSYWYERLRRFRESKNMTQKEFAEKIGIDPTALSRYERGIGAKGFSYKLRNTITNTFGKEASDYIEHGEMVHGENVIHAPNSQVATGDNNVQIHGRKNRVVPPSQDFGDLSLEEQVIVKMLRELDDERREDAYFEVMQLIREIKRR